MREIPILFSAPMVRALLEDRKTVTRRIVKPQPEERLWPIWKQFPEQRPTPYGEPGDELWVRENFRYETLLEDLSPKMVAGSTIRYEADGLIRGEPIDRVGATGRRWGRLRPGIHMPRADSRLTLYIVSIRVERLQDITEEDAKREGVRHHDASGVFDGGDGLCFHSARGAYDHLWGKINGLHGPGSWAANPWCWRIEFRRIA